MNGRIVCIDGFSMSVKGSSRHYCTPQNDVGPYSEVEIGFPSEAEPLINEFAEAPDNPTQTVYGWVKSEIVWDVILKHGGIKSGELPVLCMGG